MAYQVLFDVSQEIVTVIDNSIIVTDTVICILRVNSEVGYSLQILGSSSLDSRQVTTHLTQDDRTVSNGLKLIDNTHHAINAV